MIQVHCNKSCLTSSFIHQRSIIKAAEPLDIHVAEKPGRAGHTERRRAPWPAQGPKAWKKVASMLPLIIYPKKSTTESKLKSTTERAFPHPSLRCPLDRHIPNPVLLDSCAWLQAPEQETVKRIE